MVSATAALVAACGGSRGVADGGGPTTGAAGSGSVQDAAAGAGGGDAPSSDGAGAPGQDAPLELPGGSAGAPDGDARGEAIADAADAIVERDAADAAVSVANWPKIWGATDSDTTVGSVVARPDGSLVVAGWFQASPFDIDPTAGVDLHTGPGGATENNMYFVVALGADGSYQWGRVWDGTHAFLGITLAPLPDGSVVMGGYYEGGLDLDPGPNVVSSNGSIGYYVIRLGPGGDYQWSHTWTDGKFWFPLGRPVATDSQGNIYVTGSFTAFDADPGPALHQVTAAGGSDVAVVKLDGSGAFVWARGFGGPLDDEAKGIAVAGGDRVAVTGLFRGTADLDSSAAIDSHTAAAMTDAFAVGLSSAGDHLWAWTHSGAATIKVEGDIIAGAPDGSVAVAGYDGGYFLAGISKTGGQAWLLPDAPRTNFYGAGGLTFAPNGELGVLGGWAAASPDAGAHPVGGLLATFGAEGVLVRSVAFDTGEGADKIGEVAFDARGTAYFTVDFGRGGATVPVDGAAKRVAAIGFGNGLLARVAAP